MLVVAMCSCRLAPTTATLWHRCLHFRKAIRSCRRAPTDVVPWLLLVHWSLVNLRTWQPAGECDAVGLVPCSSLPSMSRRILFLTSTYPRWRGDTTTPFVHHLATDLQGRGWEVGVLAPHSPGAATVEV